MCEYSIEVLMSFLINVFFFLGRKFLQVLIEGVKSTKLTLHHQSIVTESKDVQLLPLNGTDQCLVRNLY